MIYISWYPGVRLFDSLACSSAQGGYRRNNKKSEIVQRSQRAITGLQEQETYITEEGNKRNKRKCFKKVS